MTDIEQFYKCDFHRHSFKDKEKSNTGKDISALAEKVNASTIDCFAVTEHNIFPAGDFEALKKNLDEGKVLFPGIEVNVILSESVIEDNALQVAPDVTYFQGVVIFDPGSTDDELMKIQNLFAESCGYIEQITIPGWKKISKNYGNKTVELDKLQEILKDFSYVFFPHENKGSKGRNISNYLSNRFGANEHAANINQTYFSIIHLDWMVKLVEITGMMCLQKPI